MGEEALRVYTWELITRLEDHLQQLGIAYAIPVALESDSLVDLRGALKALIIALNSSAPI